jgi:hypothetical protein
MTNGFDYGFSVVLRPHVGSQEGTNLEGSFNIPPDTGSCFVTCSKVQRRSYPGKLQFTFAPDWMPLRTLRHSKSCKTSFPGIGYT